MEETGFLIERSKQPCARRKCATESRVCMGCRNDIGIRAVDAAVNRGRRGVDRSGPVINVGILVDANEIVGMNRRKMLCVRVDPKPIVKLRVAYRNMSGYAFGEPESREDAKC